MILSELRANAWKLSAIALTAGLVIAVVACLAFRAKSIADASAARFAEQEAKVLADELASTREAMAKERAKAQQLAVVATQYEQDKRDAEQTANRLRDQLRAGTVRLRPHWTCPGVSETPATAAEPDATADDRAESAGRIVRAADDADAQIRALQDFIRSEREVGIVK